MRNTGLVAAAAAVVIGAGVPLALAAPSAPTAAPPSDSQGYVDSTARCTAPDTAVVFGATATSRVAICKTAAGTFEYRGVRVSDGAKLIATATQTSGDSFVAKSDGVSYTVTTKALSVTAGGTTFRTEAWTDFHAPQAPASATTSGTTKPSTSTSAATSTTSPATSSAAPTTSSAPSSSAAATSSAPKTSAAPASTAAPLGPPLPAEVGGSSTR